MRFVNSIRIKLVIALILPLAIIACVVAYETFLNARKVSNDLHDKTLLAVALAITENVVASDGDAVAEAMLEVLTTNLGDQFFYHLAGPNNAFITGYNGVPKLPDGLELKSTEPVFYDAIYQGDPVRVVAIRLFSGSEFLNGWATITTWRRVSQRDSVTLSLFSRSLARLGFLILSAGLIVWIAVAYGLKPLGSLRDAIERRSPTDLSPIRRSFPIELRGIARAMNDLLARVSRSKANRERFIGDAAHQLRTPIAALKLQAQSSMADDNLDDLKSGYRRMLNTIDETSAMIEHLLASAGAHTLTSEQKELVNVTDLTAGIARFLAPGALEHNHDFSFIETLEALHVSGHEILLREAITNIIDNAICHNPNGSSIVVSVYQNDAKDRVHICVSDNGNPLSEDDLNLLSQPFATGKTQSSGSGLGLSVAKDVAKAHGGDLTVAQHNDGRKSIEISVPTTE